MKIKDAWKQFRGENIITHKIKDIPSWFGYGELFSDRMLRNHATLRRRTTEKGTESGRLCFIPPSKLNLNPQPFTQAMIYPTEKGDVYIEITGKAKTIRKIVRMVQNHPVTQLTAQWH